MSKINSRLQNKYLKKATQARGEVIDFTILLERKIDETIAGYFFKNQQQKIDLIEVLISSETLTYNSKINLLIRLLKKIYTTEVFNKRFVAMAENLQNIGKVRNYFAHQILFIPTENKEYSMYEICLVDMKEISKHIDYTKAKINELLQKVEKYIKVINSIREEISGMGNPTEVLI